MAQVRGLGPRIGGPSGAVLHSSREPDVPRPRSDFMDMLRRLINCRIIIIIIYDYYYTTLLTIKHI